MPFPPPVLPLSFFAAVVVDVVLLVTGAGVASVPVGAFLVLRGSRVALALPLGVTAAAGGGAAVVVAGRTAVGRTAGATDVLVVGRVLRWGRAEAALLVVGRGAARNSCAEFGVVLGTDGPPSARVLPPGSLGRGRPEAEGGAD